MRPFWIAKALMQDGEPAPPLQGEQHSDICIIGGGFTGLWTAIQTKQQNPALQISILEQDVCGAGASGRNGGCILTWSARFFTLLRLFGAAEAVRLVKASEAAVHNIAEFCRQHGIDADLRLDGTLYTASNAAQAGSMEGVIKALRTHGLDSYYPLAPQQVARRSGSARNIEGVFSPYAATVDPGRLVRGLRKVALNMGIRIYEHTTMTDFKPGKVIRIHCPGGLMHANKLVLAINAWMASYFAQFERSIAVVSSDIIITEKCPELLSQTGLSDGISVLDSRTFVYYYRSTSDGRLMFGKGGNTFAWRNRITPSFDLPSRYQAQLAQSLLGFFPTLQNVPVVASWNGPSDRSVTGLPFFGRLDHNDNIFYGFGYSGNGVGPSYMGGQILSSLLLEQDNAWTRSPLLKGPLGCFPPEPIRYLGAHLVRNAIRRKEMAEDRQRPVRILDQFLSRFANAAGKADKT